MHSILDEERGECVRCVKENPTCACGSVCCPLVCILVVILTSLRTVPAGHLGLRTTFGSPSPDLLTPGLHVTSPWAGVEHFSVKTTRFEQSNTVPTKESKAVPEPSDSVVGNRAHDEDKLSHADF